MFRISLEGNKTFSWDSTRACPKLICSIAGIRQTIGTPQEKVSNLLDIARERRLHAEEQRPIFTAFMMKLAQGVKGYRLGLKTLEEIRGVDVENKEAVREIFDDVLNKNLRVLNVMNYDVNSSPVFLNDLKMSLSRNPKRRKRRK